MPFLKTACGSTSLRSGSFAVGVYTLVFYTIFVVLASLHVEVVFYSRVLFILSLFLIAASGLTVTGSILLLIGICVDSKKLLLPWVAAISANTLLDLALCCFFLFEDDTRFNFFLSCLYLSDISVCLVNVYSVILVLSLYKEYSAAENDNEQGARNFRIILTKGGDTASDLVVGRQVVVRAINFDCELAAVRSEDGDNPSRVSCVSSNPRSRTNSCSGHDGCRHAASLSERLNVINISQDSSSKGACSQETPTSVGTQGGQQCQ